MRRLLLLFLCVGLLSTTSYAQTIATAQPGPWNLGSTWSGGVVPTAANSTAIQVDHNVNIPSGFTATVDQVTVAAAVDLTVDAGGTLNLQNSGGTDLTLQEDFVILFVGANLIVNGDFINNSVSPVDYGSGLSTVTFNSGGRYVHAINGQSIPPASSTTWSSSSTVEVTGVTNIAPTGLNQALGNLTWNCSSQTASNPALNLTVINGNLTISNTGAGLVTLTNTGGTITILGNFTVSGTGRFLGSTNVAANVNVGGDFSHTSSNVSNSILVSTGSVTFNLNVAKNFTVSGRLQGRATSNPTANINFNGNTVQLFNTTGGTFTNNINWTIRNGSTVDAGTSAFVTPGNFTLEGGATLKVGSPDGISTGVSIGNVRVSGTRTYTAGGNIVYNGTVAQNLGDEWSSGNPLNSVAVNLEIASTGAGSVTNNTISGANVVGNLTLTSGSFNIGNSNTLNIQSAFTTVAGTIGGSSNSNLTFSGSGTLGALTFTPGTEVINNLTVARTATLTLGSNLTVFGTIALTNGNLDISGRSLTISGSGFTGSGTGLISSATSNLTLGGSTFTGAVPFSGLGNQLNTLTFATVAPGGTYSWNSPVTVNTSLTLTAGTLTHSSGITMAGGSTVFKGGASLAGSALTAASSYNVTYTGAGATGLELPTTTTGLANLTVSSSGTVTLSSNNLNINGNALFSGGTFAAGSNDIIMKGSTWTISGGLFTGGAGTTFFSGATAISGTAAFTNVNVTSTHSLTLSSGTTAIAGNLVTDGTLNAGTGTVDFNGTTTVSGSSSPSFNNITISGSLTAPATFNVAGAWANNGTFTAGSGTVVFNGTTSISGSSTTNFNSITISGTLNSPSSLNVGANFTNNGTFNRGSGTVVFNGSATQSISGSAVTDFNNITVTNPVNSPAVQVQSNQNLRGVLTLSGTQTVFDADGSANTSIFRLISSADSPTTDASIASLPTGTSVTGNVTVQRFMSIEGANSNRIYRYISSPVSGAQVSQIQSFIPVTGTFSGASSCSGCTTAQSMFQYDETVVTDINGSGIADYNDGYLNFPVSSNTEALTSGKGYTLFVRGNIAPVSSAGSALWEVRGPINIGNVTPVSLPVSFTSSGTLANDGWNLVGNPYPSTIDWLAASGWTKTNVNNATYMLDNGLASPVYATFIGGVGANGGTRYIAAGQAFFVKSDLASPVLTASEAVKVAGQQTTFFRTESIGDVLRIALRQGNASDETLIRLATGATVNFDSELDAKKLNNPGTMFNLSSFGDDGMNYTVQAMPTLKDKKSIKLGVNQVTPGSYTLDFSGADSFSNTRMTIMLHDIYKDSYTDLRSNPSYAFEVKADPASFGNARFEVVFGVEVVTGVETPSAHISIYPNPTADIVSVEVASENEVSASVINILGATIAERSLEGDRVKKGTFSLQDQAGGMYLLIVKDGANVYKTRIIKK